ncbi:MULTISPECIES: MarC family protein [unclassified Paludibacterium]|uniref:MarC family protein n=1 Tax=unclassified Paludibacterium TaxID=2618429 RepID=UPI001C054FB2|nr:MarC family protein [Paludibacterium sp. B53371]BEV70676.1 YchE family NAAT transporter [Paludibacterium sp. THUN1379]
MELEVSKIFMALLVLINPLSAVPIFIGLTPHSSQAERKKIAKLASITIAAVVCLFSLVGQGLLSFLGISIGSFQVAGGLLVLMIALAMMNAQETPTKTTDEERSEAESKANIAVVPLAIPLMSGPGAISTVIIYATTAHTWIDVAKIIVSGLMVAVVCYGALNMATPISRVLGKTGINIVNRVMGMLLAALSVEIMVDGLYRLFPHLGAH